MITAFYAGILGLIFVALTIMIIRLRRRYQVSLGDGGHADLHCRIRAQGNFAEMVPITLLLLGWAEMQNLPLSLVHVLGVGLIIARLCHIHAIYTGTLPTRVIGMVGTMAIIAITSIWNIYFVLGALSH